MKNKIHICFRLDDPSAISDHNLETKIFEVFNRHDGYLYVGVIPCKIQKNGYKVRISKENMSHIIEFSNKGIVTIAQHGYNHVNNSNKVSNIPSEFISLDYQEQLNRIKEGQKILNSVFKDKIEGFIPPYNSFDLNTLSALRHLNFKFVSGSPEYPMNGFKEDKKINLIPRTCTLKNVIYAIKEAKRYRALNPFIIVVMHPDEFKEFKDPPSLGEPPPFTNLEDLDHLLKFLNKENEFQISPINDIYSSKRDHLRLWHVQNRRWFKYLPWRIKSSLPKHILLQKLCFSKT